MARCIRRGAVMCRPCQDLVPRLSPVPALAADTIPRHPRLPRPAATTCRICANEYRNGYDVGAKDRSYGYPRDHRRAYERFGRGYESYFQEGYADGYDGRGLRH